MLIQITQEIPDEVFALIVAGFQRRNLKVDENQSDLDHIIETMKDKFKQDVLLGLKEIAAEQAASQVVLPEF